MEAEGGASSWRRRHGASASALGERTATTGRPVACARTRATKLRFVGAVIAIATVLWAVIGGHAIKWVNGS